MIGEKMIANIMVLSRRNILTLLASCARKCVLVCSSARNILQKARAGARKQNNYTIFHVTFALIATSYLVPAYNSTFVIQASKRIRIS